VGLEREPDREYGVYESEHHCQVFLQKNLTKCTEICYSDNIKHQVSSEVVSLSAKPPQAKIQQPTSAAGNIWHQISSGDREYWRASDFPHFPTAAVMQTLSRLCKAGKLQRVSKGIYYIPHQTRFGLSRPSIAEIHQLSTPQNLLPAGITAANLLGFTTQNSLTGEYATPANSFPLKIAGDRVRIHTRRPAIWQNLTPIDAALLDFLRSRGRLSELTPLETKQKLLDFFRGSSRFEELLPVIATEPPRVRAMVGAIGQEIGKNDRVLESLRQSLNPISKFDFGILNNLQYAKEWQAK
jgi:hypothetical protein